MFKYTLDLNEKLMVLMVQTYHATELRLWKFYCSNIVQTLQGIVYLVVFSMVWLLLTLSRGHQFLLVQIIPYHVLPMQFFIKEI